MIMLLSLLKMLITIPAVLPLPVSIYTIILLRTLERQSVWPLIVAVHELIKKYLLLVTLQAGCLLDFGPHCTPAGSGSCSPF